MKGLVKSFLGRIVDEYRINWILGSDDCRPAVMARSLPMVALDAAMLEQIAASATPKVRNSLTFAQAGLEGLALVEQGKPVCVAHFARPDCYGCDETWPLRSGEIALMDIATEEAGRGRGHAARLIAAASDHFLMQGHSRLIAFVWWSNRPSLRAFAKAGWRRIGFSLEWQRGGRWHALHIPLHLHMPSIPCEARPAR